MSLRIAVQCAGGKSCWCRNLERRPQVLICTTAQEILQGPSKNSLSSSPPHSHLASVSTICKSKKLGSVGRKGAFRSLWCPLLAGTSLSPTCPWFPRIWPAGRLWSPHDPIPPGIFCPKSGFRLQPDSASPSWTTVLLACTAVGACRRCRRQGAWYFLHL